MYYGTEENMDIGALFALKQAWSKFCSNHPKFPEFLLAVRNKGIKAGTEYTFTVTCPDGQTLRAGIRLKESDVEIIEKVFGIVGEK